MLGQVLGRHAPLVITVVVDILSGQRSLPRVKAGSQHLVVELGSGVLVVLGQNVRPLQPRDHQLRDSIPLENVVLRVGVPRLYPLGVRMVRTDEFSAFVADQSF